MTSVSGPYSLGRDNQLALSSQIQVPGQKGNDSCLCPSSDSFGSSVGFHELPWRSGASASWLFNARPFFQALPDRRGWVLGSTLSPLPQWPREAQITFQVWQL